MGFSDIGCYGSEIPTPNLDKLAAGGLRFTQFYNTGRCCPTRASVLTGLYPHQAGVGHMIEDRGAPGYRGRLNDRCVTLGEVLGGAGYFTAMSGKWHVGQDHGVVPWERGFQRSLNSPKGGFYYPEGNRDRLFLNGKALADDAPELPKNWYTTDLYTDFGIRFIDEALAAKKPFLLYLAYNAPHFPLAGAAGRNRPVPRQVQDRLGQAPRATPRPAEGTGRGGQILAAVAPPQRGAGVGLVQRGRAGPLRPHHGHLCRLRGAHGHRGGRLVAALQQRGVLDNTLILFLSDNGGNAESGPGAGWKGIRPGRPARRSSAASRGPRWRILRSRRYKHFNHEGGIATPLIAHWPAGIAARGELRQQPGHLVDIMATCVDLAGAKYPGRVPWPGRSCRWKASSLVPAFANQPIQRDALFLGA